MNMVTLISSAALNPSITGTSNVARIAGGNEGALQNSAAFDGIINGAGNTDWTNKTQDGLGGIDITAAEIMSDGTIGSRFTPDNGWTTENGRLPGLSGEAVGLPGHLR
jgi:hypothetical protein